MPRLAGFSWREENIKRTIYKYQIQRSCPKDLGGSMVFKFNSSRNIQDACPHYHESASLSPCQQQSYFPPNEQRTKKYVKYIMFQHYKD